MAKKRILIIEDSPLNMKLFKTVLEKIGNYEVISAEEAEGGIRLAREKQPDLILMDIQLPGMDGLQATKIIKNDTKLKDIPVVAVTAFAMPSDEKNVKEAGCNGYITKPIKIKEFADKVAFFINNETFKKEEK